MGNCCSKFYCRSGFCYCFVEFCVNTIISSFLSRAKSAIESNLEKIAIAEKELSSLISKGINQDNEEKIQSLRKRLQDCYADVLTDPIYGLKRNCESKLWTSTFERILETYRKQLQEKDEKEEQDAIKEKICSITSEGSKYFQNVVERLQQEFDFKLDELLKSDPVINLSQVPDRVRVALKSIQKMYIYLGDLDAYKEKLKAKPRHGVSRSFYRKAEQIYRSGHLYNRLALLSTGSGRNLDIVYYYIKSMSVNDPSTSARNALVKLFEDASQKYATYEAKRAKEISEVLPNTEEAKGIFEEWIKPNGDSNHRPAEIHSNLDSSVLKDLPDDELNRRFVTSFLHVHGMLFTNNGMEKFPSVLKQMLKEFYWLLRRTPLAVTELRLSQLLAMNIFSVHNSAPKHIGRERGQISHQQERALFTSMAMMSILMERCCMVHNVYKSFTDSPICEDLSSLLPSVKIWADWMSCQPNLWKPIDSSILKELNIGFVKNVWKPFADLLNVLGSLNIEYPIALTTKEKDCDVLFLEEDDVFLGFTPLTALKAPVYVCQPYDKFSYKDAVRINHVRKFGDSVSREKEPCLRFDARHKIFASTVRDEGFKAPSSQNGASEKSKERREYVLRTEAKNLIPDARCFIDNYLLMKDLLAAKRHNLVVPAVVLKELEDFASGTRVKEGTSKQHANRISLMSLEASTFLKKQFEEKNPHLKILTSKASIVDTISNSEEIPKDKDSTDELILHCCLHYCKDKPDKGMRKKADKSVTVLREAVLLTEDRDLRIKATAQQVPVTDLQSFLQWVNA